MGAPLDLASRSPFRLRSARTLSTTYLGFEFLQCPQHVLSNLLDRPHSSVLARSTTIASPSPFPWPLPWPFPPSPPFTFQSEIRCSLGFVSGWAAKQAFLSASYTLH